MSQFALSALVTSVTTFLLAFFVISRGFKNKVYQIFSAYSLSISLWSFLVFVHGYAENRQASLYAAYSLHIPAALIPVLFVHFVQVFLDLKGKWHKSWRVAAYIIAFGFLPFTFSEIFVKDVVPKYGIRHLMIPGGGFYYLFIAVFIANVIYGLSFLGKAYFVSKGFRRNQLKYLFFGSVVGYAGGIDNFLIIHDIAIFPLYPYGTYAVALYVLTTAYAIAAYRLLDIEVLIRRTAVFAGLSAFVLGTIVFSSVLVQDILGTTAGLSRIWTQLLSAIIIIALFDLVRKFLVEVTDRFLFQKKYDYKKILRSLIDEIVTVFNLDEIVERTIRLLEETLHPEMIAFLLFEKAGDEFKLYRAVGYADKELKLNGTSKIAMFIRTQRELLSLEDHRSRSKFTDDLKREMSSLKAHLAVPLILQSELIGMMLLGAKKSGEDYSQEELDSLTDLSKTEAIAIKNARYLEELNAANAEVQHAKTMKQIADMADGMSHQFNNRFQAISVPLGVLRMVLEKAIASCDGLSPEEQLRKLKEVFSKTTETVSKAAANAVRGGDIAKGLLKYARPEKAGFEMHDISKVINLSLEMLGYKHDDLAEIEIVRNFPKDLPMTWANISYLQDIYFIVLDNAYDAIKQKKETGSDIKGKIFIDISHDKTRNRIHIVIKDNGIGMKPEILEKVKAAVPYVTTKASSSQKSGYGSGVQVLTRLIKLHNGTIDYESVCGEGTTTAIDIPVRGKPTDQSSDENGRQ